MDMKRTISQAALVFIALCAVTFTGCTGQSVLQDDFSAAELSQSVGSGTDLSVDRTASSALDKELPAKHPGAGEKK